ncbi:MAG TPA: ATP-grasp domain-containing protein [Gaiellaceae bacterium]|jgi:biotin carboxylase|nr:ATP-grasp domain-containing protein [Gaiellaceae bacterium]
MQTVLFVGAGLHQRRAIEQARAAGLRVVAVDGNPDARGLALADVGETADFSAVDEIVAFARAQRVDGVLTISADRAVPVVAAVAERMALPGIGTETAHRMTNKVAMRRTLADAGVPQPRFAAIRGLNEADAALAQVGLPAVLKPADSGGQRGLFRIDSRDGLERHLHAALAESPTQEAILEEFVDGLELNGLAVARDAEVTLLTLSDRLRPPGVGFGVGWIHVYPSSLYGDALEEAERVATSAVRALGLENGVSFPQLLAADDGRVLVVEVAARVPGGQMADLARHAIGVDVVEIALRQALGEAVPDELVTRRFDRPLAIRFLTASPGPLPVGRVVRVRSLERARTATGVLQVELFIQEGEVIRPVRVDADRRGYVIATGPTSILALEAAEGAARLIEVEVEAVADARVG